MNIVSHQIFARKYRSRCQAKSKWIFSQPIQLKLSLFLLLLFYLFGQTNTTQTRREANVQTLNKNPSGYSSTLHLSNLLGTCLTLFSIFQDVLSTKQNEPQNLIMFFTTFISSQKGLNVQLSTIIYRGFTLNNVNIF